MIDFEWFDKLWIQVRKLPNKEIDVINQREKKFLNLKPN